ncbi:MAG: NAD(+)/NADH kinase [Ignavibacteriaceae bacterium]
MKFGIVGNYNKGNINDVIFSLVNKLEKKKIEYYICDSLAKSPWPLKEFPLVDIKTVAEKSDLLLSIGGDGTMLSTAYTAHQYEKPVVGINIGKLGFLAEVDIHNVDTFLDNVLEGKYRIEERMVLTGRCSTHKTDEFIAFNDIVVDKGNWPKMIEITIKVDGESVATYSADGLIIATPTGSTGYSLSVGGPIVSPKSNVITLSPISPHTLTVRPLVIPNNQVVSVFVESANNKVQVNCDGQRVKEFTSPIELEIKKDPKSIKILHTSDSSYFEILRTKLLWGLDIRKNF